MVFSRFIWNIIFLVAIILATAVALGIYLQKPGFPVTLSLLIVLLVIETISLLYYLTKIRRDLMRLVNALRNEDPTLQFSRKQNDPYFTAIHRGFNEIIRNFRLVRLDKEAEQRFFEATVNHVPFGLVAFDRDGKVEMVNEAFLNLFGIEKIERVDLLLKVSEELPGLFKQLTHQRELLRKIRINGIPHHLIFLASLFRLKGEEVTLLSVRDLSRELDRNELEAWQKLLRVLRHEILNSITPMKLLSANLSEMLEKDGKIRSMGDLTEKEIGDLKTGLDTIHRRSTSLSNFLDAYSNLYRIPELNPERIRVRPLLERTASLFREQVARDKIDFRIECPDSNLSITMDERMIEQVLINLVKNAIQAVQPTPHRQITLSTGTRDSIPVLTVRDNGEGIPGDQIDSIFIPFYTTRESGSGIGLSFTQQVMKLHNGHVNVVSREGEGSEFQLHFGTIENPIKEPIGSHSEL